MIPLSFIWEADFLPGEKSILCINSYLFDMYGEWT